MPVLASAKQLGRSLLELIYPAVCTACDQPCPENRGFCESCQFSVEPICYPCSICGFALSRPTSRCLRCQTARWWFDWAHAPFLYGGALADSIRRLKWTQRYHIARPLGLALAQSARDCEAELIIPVPLHQRRLRERGYNQAALLALHLAKQRKMVLQLNALHRASDTKPQSRLALTDRAVNVAGAFVASPRLVLGRRVILVDDVMTSGATLDSCAQALKRAGAVHVIALTLARAMP